MRTFATAWMIVCFGVFAVVLVLAAVGIGEQGMATVARFREMDVQSAAAVVMPVWTVAPVATETATPGPCGCIGDLMNCGDFANSSDAQACYAYCLVVVGSDTHDLDRDRDGLACEP